MRAVILVSFLFIASSTSFAAPVSPMLLTPSIIGPTGLVRIPNADVLPYKNYNIGLDYGTDPSNNRESMYYKVNLGTFRNMEMGIVGQMDPDTKKVKEGVFINMKLSLATDDQPYPLKLAIGVENLTSYTQNDVYMVATKYFQQGPKLTFGFMGDFPNSKFRPLGCAGIEVPFMDNYIIGLADIMAGESMTQLDLGARVFIGSSFAVHVNAVNILKDEVNNVGRDPKCYLIGFSWINPF
jgi:hypothetical protein